MFVRVSSFLVALAVAIVVTGCSKAPEAERLACDQAMSGAQMAEAEAYAPASYQQAQDSLNAAKVEIQNQDSKFALFRSYGRSKEMLVATKALADKAVTDATAAKERVRQEDNTLMTNIDGLLVTTREALAKAPKGKGTKADLDLIAADLASVETAYQAAVADFNAGKFLVAKPKLEAAVNQLNRINADIEAANAKASGKR
jgi:Sec-independent protein translocase protein TatA